MKNLLFESFKDIQEGKQITDQKRIKAILDMADFNGESPISKEMAKLIKSDKNLALYINEYDISDLQNYFVLRKMNNWISLKHKSGEPVIDIYSIK